MAIARIVHIDSWLLADGIVILRRLGRKYFVTRTYVEPNTPPDLYRTMRKAEALKAVADLLKKDVLEIED